MDIQKILVADPSETFCDALSEALGGRYTLRICHDGLEALSLLDVFVPNVLIMDLALPRLDGISLLKEASSRPERPQILLATSFFSPFVAEAIGSVGVDLAVMKPCDIPSLAERVHDMTRSVQAPVVRPIRRSPSASKMLRSLNVSTGRKGFGYLETCVELYAEAPSLSVTKELYPEVARRYDSNGVAVEHAIREAIQEAWGGRNEAVWRMYFHPCRDGTVLRPTNTQFISQLAERLRQQYREKAEGYEL